jgi:dienelactone hydrolase
MAMKYKFVIVISTSILLYQNLFSQEMKKPQEPIRPFDYVEKEVSFTNPIDGTVLNGTFTLPNENSKFPAVVLVTGSGAQNRDEEILGHKPFLVIADYLTKAGFAVLRYDDRHFKMPVKQGWKYTTMDFAEDAKGAIDFLNNNHCIDTSFIGIIGHSEGGVVAPIVASEDNRVAFVISLAGTGLSGYQIACNQGRDLAKNAKEEEFSKKALEVIVNEPDINTRKKKLWDINNAIYGRFNLKARSELKSTIEMSISEWNRFFIKYNPSVAWKKVLCPVLAINGEYDIQVIPDENLNAIDKALKFAGNKDYSIVTIPKANHLFQIVESGGQKGYSSLIAEYQKTEQTFSPDVLKIIGDWMLSKYKNKQK